VCFLAFSYINVLSCFWLDLVEVIIDHLINHISYVNVAVASDYPGV